MTCETLTAVRAAPGTPASATGTHMPTGAGAIICNGASGRYIIYALEELASGRHYVGLTRRSLDERIASHLAQSRRDRPIRAGGLMAALRLMDALGQSFRR